MSIWLLQTRWFGSLQSLGNDNVSHTCMRFVSLSLCIVLPGTTYCYIIPEYKGEVSQAGLIFHEYLIDQSERSIVLKLMAGVDKSLVRFVEVHL